MANAEKRPLKVFLCHASGDKPPVRDLYRQLSAEGVDAWLDQEKLLPGQDWHLEIPKAVRDADVVVICLSQKSITKEGYVQREIKFALDIAEEKPEGTIFLIPARLEDCPVPERLGRWQWVDLYEQNGFGRLLRSLKLRADAVGAAVEPSSGRDTGEALDRRLEQLYTEGLAAFYTDDWETACQRFQAILHEQPDHRKAADKLAEAECQRYWAGLYAQASDAYRLQDWPRAIRALEELSQKSPDYKDAAARLGNARKQKQLGDLYAEAEALHAAGKWQAVVKVFEQIAGLDRDYPDLKGLLASAQKEVAELERLAELSERYGQALRAMESADWTEARRLLEWIQKSRAGFRETEKLLRKMEAEISRAEELRRQQDQVSTLYEQTHGLLRAKKWRSVLDKLAQIRDLDEGFADADGIAARAQAELDREAREADRQNSLAALYAAAVQLLKEERYREALDKWQEVRALEPAYPDRQWVQRTARRKLTDAGRDPIVRPGRESVSSKVIELPAGMRASIAAQIGAGWLILFVAAGWGAGRWSIEALARATNFLGLSDAIFWATEIIAGTFGLLYGMAIWAMLYLLKVPIRNKRGILLIAGWMIAFLSLPLIGWGLLPLTDQGWNIAYLLAGLIASLGTGLVLRSLAILPRRRQILILAAGMTLAIYAGEQVFPVLQSVEPVDIYGIDASARLALGSFTGGLFCAWILYHQVTRSGQRTDAARREWPILFMTAAWFLARFTAEWIGYNLIWGVGLHVENQFWPVKTLVALLLSGVFSGMVLWVGLQLAFKRLTARHLFLLMLYWTAGMLLAGLPAIVLRSGQAWLWSSGLGVGSWFAMYFSLRLPGLAGSVSDRQRHILVCTVTGLGFAVGNLWLGDLYFSNLQVMREDYAFAVAIALQNALAGFLAMIALLPAAMDLRQSGRALRAFVLGGLLGLLAGDLANTLFFKEYGISSVALAGFALAGLVLGAGLTLPTRSWRTILLMAASGAYAYAGAMALWWHISAGRVSAIVLLYLIFGLCWGTGFSIGQPRLSRILLLCCAGFFGLLIQHRILPYQAEGSFLYWISFVIRDLILGGFIGLAWAYFLHGAPVVEAGQVRLAEPAGSV